MDSLLALASHWRERAEELRRWADAEGSARALEGCAIELEEAVRAAQGQALTLQEAASVSGYSKRRLRELVAEGSLPNIGRKHAPRLRRGDLPRKALKAQTDYDVRADAEALADRMHDLEGRP